MKNAPASIERDGAAYVRSDLHDTLAKRADALHKALREEVVGGNDEYVGCALCNGGWRYGEPESHAPDCLASPSAPKGPQQTTGNLGNYIVDKRTVLQSNSLVGSVPVLCSIPAIDIFRCIPVSFSSSAGTRYERQVAVGMPQLGRYSELLQTVFFLYPSSEAAGSGEGYGGSGFILSVPAETFPDRNHIYAVTNWHVACRDGCSVIRINRVDGKHDIFEFDPSDWYYQPGGADLAVAPLAGLDRRVHVVSALSASIWCMSEADLKELEVNAGDDVFMIGRFIDYEGAETNVPSMRFGNISILEAPIKQPTASSRNSIVLDMHSRSGYSGSPVFIYRTSGSHFGEYDPNDFGNTSLFLGHLIKLLGIHWGQFPEKWEIRSESQIGDEASLITDGAYVRGLSGMTCCVPSHDILRLLNMPTLQKKRRDDEAAYAAHLKKSGKDEPMSESARPPREDDVLKKMLDTPPKPHKKDD